MQRRRAHRSLPWLLVAAALFVGGFAALFHEPWRDEAQTVLVGRLSAWEIVGVARVEGVPPGIFFLMKALDAVFGNVSLAVLSGLGYGALLAGIFKLVRELTDARGAAITAGLLALSYPCLFESGIVARQYGLAHGLALSGCAAALVYARRRHGVLLPMAFFAAGCGLLNLHAACLVSAAVAVAASVRAARTASVRPLLEALACAPGPLLALAFALPFAERASHMNESADIGDVRFASVLRVWRRAFFQAEGTWMLPEWPSKELVDRLELPTFIGIALVVLVAAVRRHRRAPFAIFGAGWVLAAAALTYTFVTRSGAHYRHLIFISLPAAAALLGLGIELSRRRPWLGIPALLLLSPWVLLLNGLGLGTLYEDYGRSFASAKAQATVFPPGAQLVAATGAPIAVLYYRPDVRFRAATNEGRPMRHMLPDRSFFTQVPFTSLVKAACADATDLGRVWTSALYVYPECSTGLIPGRGRVEAWTWYVLDCSCVAGR